MKAFYDIDILVSNSVELDKTEETDEPVISVEYGLNNIMACISDNIADVQADLKIVILYKGRGGTVMWKEQKINISGNKILNRKYDYCEATSKPLHIKRVSHRMVDTNTYKQNIYICMRIFAEDLIEELIQKDVPKVEKRFIDIGENLVKVEKQIKAPDEEVKEVTFKDDYRPKKKFKKTPKRKTLNAAENAADLLISILRDTDKK